MFDSIGRTQTNSIKTRTQNYFNCQTKSLQIKALAKEIAFLHGLHLYIMEVLKEPTSTYAYIMCRKIVKYVAEL